MPGSIRTNLQRYITDEELARIRSRMGGTDPIWKTPEQGAATSVLVATTPLLDGVGGRYFEDCNEAEPHRPGPGTRRGVADYALDPEAAALLWQVSVDTLSAGRAPAGRAPLAARPVRFGSGPPPRMQPD
jgi:hypothetical protein